MAWLSRNYSFSFSSGRIKPWFTSYWAWKITRLICQIGQVNLLVKDEYVMASTYIWIKFNLFDRSARRLTADSNVIYSWWVLSSKHVRQLWRDWSDSQNAGAAISREGKVSSGKFLNRFRMCSASLSEISKHEVLAFLNIIRMNSRQKKRINYFFCRALTVLVTSKNSYPTILNSRKCLVQLASMWQF